MVNPEVDKLTRDLFRLLGELNDLHGELARHMQNKLAAVKRADGDVIQSITARELVLADRINEREGLRRQLCRRIGLALGWPEDRLQRVRLTELAEHLDEPSRSRLLGVTAGLRKKIERIEALRVTDTLVTQEMLKHLGHVLEVMQAGGSKGDVYSPTGRREPARTAQVFEAVG